MTRRSFVALAAAAAVRAEGSRSRMGLATTCFMSFRRPNETAEFLEYSHSLGAGGIQARLSSFEPGYLKALRKRADELGMYIEIMAPLPKDRPDEFEKNARAAKEIGAVAIRAACLTGRRYENFSTLAEWKTWEAQARRWVIDAARIADKAKVPLAIENHKDRTAGELAELMRSISSEYAGVCLDSGNNMSLLEDPMEVVDTLAPFALATHIKDMAVAPAEDGFYLSEVPFGTGVLDLRKVIEIVAAARPKTRFTLEMITRDPLRVPCLTTKYWATFPDGGGYATAHMMEMARLNKGPLPKVSGLGREAQLKVEEDNVKACVDYSRRELSL